MCSVPVLQVAPTAESTVALIRTRADNGERPGARLLGENRRRVLMLPPVYRPRSVRAIEDLKVDDLAFLVRYHENRADAARAELSLRMGRF
jgi:hypothetical protein